MTPESKVKKQVKDLLNEFHAYWFMPVANMFTRGGIPDIIACFRGLFVAIECKAGVNKCTKLQELEQAKIQEAGGCTFVVSDDEQSLKDLRLFLTMYMSKDV